MPRSKAVFPALFRVLSAGVRRGTRGQLAAEADAKLASVWA